jgi:YD repeat-containing protein
LSLHHDVQLRRQRSADSDSSTSIEAATLEMQRKLDRRYAGRPRGWTRWAVLGFAGATLSAFWMPLLVPSSRRLGRRARRKRLFTACVATFLAPLMAVHPEAAHALTTEAIQAQVAITAGVALDCDDTITTTYAYDANGNQIGRTRTDSSGTHTDTYVFDYKNRLVQAATRIEGPPAFVRYTYDADGIRNRKALDANTGTFLPHRQEPALRPGHRGADRRRRPRPHRSLHLRRRPDQPNPPGRQRRIRRPLLPLRRADVHAADCRTTTPAPRRSP